MVFSVDLPEHWLTSDSPSLLHFVTSAITYKNFVLTSSLVLSPRITQEIISFTAKKKKTRQLHPILIYPRQQIFRGMHNVHNSDGDFLSYVLPTSKAKYLCKLSVILMDAVVHTAIIFYYVTARIRVFSISLCYKPKIPINSGLKSPSLF